MRGWQHCRRPYIYWQAIFIIQHLTLRGDGFYSRLPDVSDHRNSMSLIRVCDLILHLGLTGSTSCAFGILFRQNFGLLILPLLVYIRTSRRLVAMHLASWRLSLRPQPQGLLLRDTGYGLLRLQDDWKWSARLLRKISTQQSVVDYSTDVDD